MKQLWGPIEKEEWEFTPCIKGRPATENDIRTGEAIFAIPSGSSVYQMTLPACAKYRGEDGTLTPVIVIQAEQNNETVLIGARPISGGNMVCTLPDITLLDDPDDIFSQK